ncbi:hypothetical protein [Microbacterium sp. NPDC057944]|uniref:hypothetical protein n=1 Tax=Microbacterium sp. NPDC057944 TaxID=3346286 RepID=UPI0036D9D5CC
MGNELADAIRAELRSALLAKYGTLEAAAEVLDMPYKTLRRHLTTSGKDRTARVPLDFVLEVSEQLERDAGVDFAEIYRRATIRPIATVTPINVRRSSQYLESAELDITELAATTDNTPIDPDRGEA